MFEMAGGPPGRIRTKSKPVNEQDTDIDLDAKVEVRENTYLIMGDYVDRGQCSTETICLLLALKIRFPNHLYMTRGNHECEAITRTYGFFDECKRRHGLQVWKQFMSLFNYLPAAAIIDERILCMHGGLSPTLMDGHLS